VKRITTIAVIITVAGCARGPRATAAPVPAASATGAGMTPAVVQQSSSKEPVSAPSAAPGNAPSAAPSAAPRDSMTARDSVRVDSSELNRSAKEMFGDSLAHAPGDSAVDSTAAEPSWDIDVHSYESRDRVERYVRMFSGPAKEHIEARLERGSRYEPMIRAKLRAGGLPEDMYYLALIESGFDANAYSSAAAVGMWQFMTSTARDLGMRVDWWVDERRDPVKSTDGAVRFIKDLQEQFGSLYLAAAAYNGGPGRIARGLSRYADDLEGTTGDDLFFALADKDYLRSETREYVPQLIAAALVGKEPARYGMIINPEPAFAYDSVRVGPATSLSAIAAAAGATVAQIQELNPQILRGVTPPKDSLIVRLRMGAADSFPNAFAALPKSERVGLSTIETKKGQSVASIAKKGGLTAKQLASYNPHAKRLKNGNLVPGQMLVVPTAAVVAAAVSVPDPAIERYGSSRSTTMHVVRSGETLSGIAKRYHTTTAALMRTNHLKRALIFPGQSLVVHSGSKRSVSVSSAKPSAKKRKVGAASSSTHSPPS
jgi:membrane-bound lytic murein transglycosylase D